MMSNNGNATGKVVAGLAVGALIGSALGLLLAPNAGRETRTVVRQKAGNYVGLLQEKCRKPKGVKVTANTAENQESSE